MFHRNRGTISPKYPGRTKNQDKESRTVRLILLYVCFFVYVCLFLRVCMFVLMYILMYVCLYIIFIFLRVYVCGFI